MGIVVRITSSFQLLGAQEERFTLVLDCLMDKCNKECLA